mmetsp:Transcript_32023/g.36822  ORF Transcript_32023/g.36822 Transcript_32023/m.36822 type:complete len:627 (-) Transcript_32023:165-2045(-)
MARMVSTTIVDPSFESIDNSISDGVSSPSPNRVIKSVTPGSTGNGRSFPSNCSIVISEVSTTESISLRKRKCAPILTTIYSNSRLSHSPVRVQRRISQSEDEDEEEEEEEDEHSTKSENQQQHIITESNVLKYGGSFNVSGKRNSHTELQQEEMSQPKRIKSDDNSVVTAIGDTTSGSNAVDKTAAFEAAAAASTMTAMKNKKPIISPTSLGEKIDDTSDRYPQLHIPALSRHQHHLPYQNYHLGITPPPFHPHAASFGGRPYHPNGYHMPFHGYPRHGPSVTVPSFMVGQYPVHPAAASYYSSYYSGFHSPIMNQHSGQHFPSFGSPYQNLAATALLSREASSDNRGVNVEEKDRSKHGNDVIPSLIARSSSTTMLDQSINSSSSKGSCKSTTDGKPPSYNRCVPLQEPIPSKHWLKDEETKKIVLPDFHRLVNFPDYLSKSRSFVPGSTSGGSKAVGGKKHCIMCGKLRICSASSSIDKDRSGVNSDGDDGHIIPRQNKGLCTNCDVIVWVVVAEKLEIKWCKGCKNFRHWAAFGDKGSATKCVRCRHRQKEKYARQKEEIRARHNTKRGDTEENSPLQSINSSSLKSSLFKNPDIGSNEKEDETHLAAARGLRSLMNAATTAK